MKTIIYIHMKMTSILEQSLCNPLNQVQIKRKKAVSFQKITSELAESKVEEVHTLLEGLEYKDINDFDRKVKIVMDKVKTIYLIIGTAIKNLT